jgi:hypothetical protein
LRAETAQRRDCAVAADEIQGFQYYCSDKKLFTKNSRVKIGQRHLQARITFLFLKRVTGRIFTISKCVHRSKPKFFHNKAVKYLKAIGAYTESTDLIFKTFKKIIHLVTQSL